MTTQQVKTELKNLGIKANVSFIKDGSLRGYYRIYSNELVWVNNEDLQTKIKALGFIGKNGELNNYSSNGANFHIFAKFN